MHVQIEYVYELNVLLYICMEYVVINYEFVILVIICMEYVIINCELLYFPMFLWYQCL